ncbi:hypothetical protein EBR77_00800 [bacterium]|nr:hypothetical protein [bacterium]
MFFMIITSFLCMQLQATDQTIASAYPQAYTWCIQTQHELCPDKYKTISYKIGSSWKAFAIENCIYIPEDAAQDLESLSTKNNLSHAEEIQLQKYKGLLAHEIGHILYDNDPLNLGIMFATSAFLTYSTDYVIQDTGLLIRLFTCIFTGTTSLYAANFVRKQYQEISADNFVIQTKDFDAIVGLYKELEASTPQNLAKALFLQLAMCTIMGTRRCKICFMGPKSSISHKQNRQTQKSFKLCIKAYFKMYKTC